MKPLARRQVAKLTSEQRHAYDLLLFGDPGPAERARLKLQIGRRPTRTESVALARQLLNGGGHSRREVAAALQIEARHLDRLLKKGSPPENGLEKHAAEQGCCAAKRRGEGDWSS